VRECTHGHGPFEGRSCKVCDRERVAKVRQAAAAERTHCGRGHLYQPGTWRILSYPGKFGNTVEIKSCILCARAAAKKACEAAAASKNDARAKRTYPGKVNTRRVGMRERISAIHLEILDACDRMDLMTAAERAEWRAKEAGLRQEADLLQVQLDTGNSATQRAKRLRAKGLPVA